LEAGLIFNPLNLDDVTGYQQWREAKLRVYDSGQHKKVVELASTEVCDEDIDRILSACNDFNYCLYRLTDPSLGTKSFVRSMGLKLGLERLDGNLCSDEDNISSIQVRDTGRHTGYIPYTDKKLTWHTDGYYNKVSQTIRGMVLHCVRPAQSGGENLMLDHEMAYIQLRDENPDYISAFMQPDVLTIPPNIENGIEIRGAQSGPVFSLESLSGRLHMRYSARTRSIEWKADSLTSEAVACMSELLNTNNPYVITYSLQAGEGIIANNVLHNRTAFVDAEPAEQKRLLYRARCYDRVRSR
jgi:Taurine catabolism dioxygenase TauD, TfdA family